MKGYIFDLDGTLLDSMKLWSDIDRTYFTNYGIEFKEEYTQKIKTMTFEESAQYFVSEFKIDKTPEQVMQEWRKMANDAYFNHLPLKEGAFEYLNQCRKIGKLGLATTCERAMAEAALKRLKIFDYFECIITAQDVGCGKEKPDIYLKCVQLLGLNVEDCEVYEDVYKAVHTARNAGFYVTAVYDESSLEQEMSIRQEANRYIYSFNELVDECSHDVCLAAWQKNAAFWDRQMGNEANEFHRQVVRPKVSQLLEIRKEDQILDIACGNGCYSAYLANQGAKVTAFDFSEKMIQLAKKRWKIYSQIEFLTLDATNKEQLMSLGQNRYDKAVSNMALMDMNEISVLFHAVYELLKEDGIFVYATQHPCFVTLTSQYLSAHSYLDIAIKGQPSLQCYYHRSLQEIFNLGFECGFIIDGFYEESYNSKEKPDVIIVRLRKKQ